MVVAPEFAIIKVTLRRVASYLVYILLTPILSTSVRLGVVVTVGRRV